MTRKLNSIIIYCLVCECFRPFISLPNYHSSDCRKWPSWLARKPLSSLHISIIGQISAEISAIQISVVILSEKWEDHYLKISLYTAFLQMCSYGRGFIRQGVGVFWRLGWAGVFLTPWVGWASWGPVHWKVSVELLFYYNGNFNVITR